MGLELLRQLSPRRTAATHSHSDPKWMSWRVAKLFRLNHLEVFGKWYTVAGKESKCPGSPKSQDTCFFFPATVCHLPNEPATQEKRNVILCLPYHPQTPILNPNASTIRLFSCQELSISRTGTSLEIIDYVTRYHRTMLTLSMYYSLNSVKYPNACPTHPSPLRERIDWRIFPK